jgi:hypothetical protein
VDPRASWPRCCTKRPTRSRSNARSATPPRAAATNRRFADLATELGLQVGKLPPYGFAATTLTFLAVRRFSTVLRELGDALVLWREAEPTPALRPGGAEPRSSADARVHGGCAFQQARSPRRPSSAGDAANRSFPPPELRRESPL